MDPRQSVYRGSGFNFFKTKDQGSSSLRTHTQSFRGGPQQRVVRDEPQIWQRVEPATF